MSCSVWIVTLQLVVLLIHLRFNAICGELSVNECGTTQFIEPRILRGSATTKGAWPFLAALINVETQEFFCGSTVISARHVLTAAHCVQQKNSPKIRQPEEVIVLLGAYNLDRKIERGAQQREVNEIYLHPEWRPYMEKYDADLAIFLLRQIVEFTEYIRPICMPEDDPPIDEFGSIVGWGLSERTNGSTRESMPLHTYTKILNDSYCYTSDHSVAAISSTRTFCGGGEGGSPSKGDSGGGLFILSGSSWIQYGIISASSSDSRGIVLPGSSTIYTNLRRFGTWIDETVEADGSNVMTVRGREKDRKVKIDVWCSYELAAAVYYRCAVSGAISMNENLEINSFTGTHLNGRDANDVTEIWFWTGRLEYIPYGIGLKFKNLEKFWVSYIERNLGLKCLKRSNFEHMNGLWYLDVKHNDIETVDEDTLRDLPNLKSFIINNNNLKTLHTHTFDSNPKLERVNAKSNRLEFLPAELFKHNELLEEAIFTDNDLKIISIDFTRLRSMRTLDFHGNVCIDKGLDDVSSLTELQRLLNSVTWNGHWCVRGNH